MINEEYLTGNSKISYPFKSESKALAQSSDDAATAWAAGDVPLDAFIDLQILVPGNYNTLRITNMQRIVDDVFFDFTTDTDQVILSGSIPVAATPYQVVSMINNPVIPGVATLVANIIPGPGLASFPLATSIDFPVEYLHLEDCTWLTSPLRVDGFDMDAIEDVEDNNGDLTLEEGYNISLRLQQPGDLDFPDSEENEDAVAILVTAAPGLGAGRVPPDASLIPPYLVSLNSKVTAARDGTVSLVQDNCHRFVAQPSGNSVVVYNDCEPCCDCADYAGPVITMETFWPSLEASRASMLGTIELFNTHVVLWNDTILPGIRKIYITGVGVTGFVADKNKHALTINIINQGSSVPEGRVTITLPSNTKAVPKAVLEYDKEATRACSDLPDGAVPTASDITVNGTEVFVDFSPLCYCSTAQILLVVQTDNGVPPDASVVVAFTDPTNAILAGVTIPWK